MIDIRPHRRYQFRTDFDIDWMKLDEWDSEETERYEKLDENYYCFTLDFFEHSFRFFYSYDSDVSTSIKFIISQIHSIDYKWKTDTWMLKKV